MISDIQAIALATKAIEGKVTAQPGTPVTAHRQANRYIVVFGNIPVTVGSALVAGNKVE